MTFSQKRSSKWSRENELKICKKRMELNFIYFLVLDCRGNQISEYHYLIEKKTSNEHWALLNYFTSENLFLDESAILNLQLCKSAFVFMSNSFDRNICIHELRAFGLVLNWQLYFESLQSFKGRFKLARRNE